MACLERCIRQVFKPEEEIKIPAEWRPGVGDCTICTYDPVNNKNCALYRPMKIWVSEEIGSVEVGTGD